MARNTTNITPSLNDSGRCMDNYDTVDMCSWEFILKGMVLSLITVAILLGNSLVITSVFLYSKLRKSISNSFIASLALADLILAIIVLPFSTMYEMMGYWIFGSKMCSVWLVVDVWVCTASILHLCAISMDRYIAIAYPLRYRNLMTHRRCRIVCVCLWMLSFVICFPGLIDWSSKAQMPSDLNITAVVTTKIMTGNSPNQCEVADYPIGFTIYSAMGSFFIPSIIMLGFYIKIFLLAHQYMKQAQTGSIAGTENSAMRIHRGGGGGVSLSTLSPVPGHCDYDKIREDKGKSGESASTQKEENMGESKFEAELSSRNSSVRTLDRQQTSHLLPTRRLSNLTARNVMMSRETRAAKTVAIIVGCFIACWTPFFICYVIQGVRREELDVHLFHFFIWVGYINSLLNPCIYACFSNDYRHAFKKILRCQVRRSGAKRSGIGRYFSSLYISSTSCRADTTSNTRSAILIKARRLNSKTDLRAATLARA